MADIVMELALCGLWLAMAVFVWRPVRATIQAAVTGAIALLVVASISGLVTLRAPDEVEFGLTLAWLALLGVYVILAIRRASRPGAG